MHFWAPEIDPAHPMDCTQPERYVLQIFWQTLEDHTVGFRQSSAFTEWRALVGPFFAAPPQVEHFELVTQSA